MFWPCETRTSTCRSFATISSGLYRFLAITVLLDVKDIPQVGPLQWGWITASQGGDEDIPVPAQEVCVHAEGLKTTRGGEGPCDDGPAPVAFCLPRRHRHPGLHC